MAKKTKWILLVVSICLALALIPVASAQIITEPLLGDYNLTNVIICIIAAAGGGAFGAAIGAIPAFAFCGFLAFLGSVQEMVGAPASAYSLAFGPFMGPHVAFAAACAAAAYAAKYEPGLIEHDDWGYHDAKNILATLSPKLSILAVGGLFGIFGQALKMGTDYFIGGYAGFGFAHIAWVVVASAIVHRIVFRYPIIGDMKKVAKRVGSELKEGISWFSFSIGDAEPHLPWQFEWKTVLALGAFVGLISAYITILTGDPWIMFGASAAMLILLETDWGFRPDNPKAGLIVTHHITMPAAIASIASIAGGQPVAVAVLWGVIFGVLGAFFRELTERAFYAWGDTHWDPPATSITITIFIIVVLSWVGVLGNNTMNVLGPILF